MSQKYEICLRLDEKEKERLETDAKRCGLTRNAYLRRLITGGEIKERPKRKSNCSGQRFIKSGTTSTSSPGWRTHAERTRRTCGESSSP